ncbi:MAG: YfhO family protein [Actinobacteria bacterium]|nr:YfhO family protein [Actinomycetota bacterium]
MLFEIPDALGYSPVQLSRYWSYVRATNQVPIFYNAAVLQEPTLSDARILGARYLIAPTHIEPRLPGKRVLREGRFDLWEIRGYQRRASVVADWYVAPRASVALLYVLQPAFDPRELVVLEGEPGLERDPEAPPRSGTAAYRQEGIEEAVVTVESSAPALVLVRNAWDRNWTATVDGEPAPVLRADYLLQAVPVPAGSHEVRLVYRDPMLYAGLAASAVAWGALGAAAATAAVIDRRRRYRRSSEDEGSREGSREGSGTGSTGA